MTDLTADDPKRPGPHRVLILLYALFTVAAGARALVQLVQNADEAPVAYTLSALSACTYALGWYAIRRAAAGRFGFAQVMLSLELTGVLVVGTLSLVKRDWFPDASVWSDYGIGYGFVPALLPIAGLVWLRRQQRWPATVAVRPPRLRDVIRERAVVLDGGLATQLEAQGHDLGSDLWSARLLSDDPDEVVRAHRTFFEAGAEVAITASYQASFDGLAAAGYDRARAEDLLRASVELAARARDQLPDGKPRWIAASVGPYGAALADGSEYHGNYGLDLGELRAWHRPRLAVLADSGADVLAVETIPSAIEAEALLLELAELDVDAWLSLTCAAGTTRGGEPVEPVYELAASVDQVLAVGVNCLDASEVADLTTRAAAASGKPVVAYPNSGEGWDSEARAWTGSSTFTTASTGRWLDAGARLIGGCCRVTPADIAALKNSLQGRGVGVGG